MNTLIETIKQIKKNPEKVEFNNIINLVENHYDYTPTSFRNGIADDCIINMAKENEGSCKIFSFAKLHNLTELQTLHCFGKYYRDDVLKYPDATDHGNIRTFMKYGWEHIQFDGKALIEK